MGRVRHRRLHRINHEIQSSQVRVVGSEEETESGVMSTRVALGMAEEKGMDLVEINANMDPPICRIIEYSKFKYEQSKRDKEKKKKQHVVQMKEIRFGPNTDEHDFNFKLKHAEKFLEDGNKVKAFVHFRGRSIIYTDRGKKLLLEFAQALEELGRVEMLPKLEGKRMYLILAPKSAPKK
ncbi:MAG TPA: translation initiation factor IF-3 [Bacteroidetes bacterium]|nr:translation initiation factor IF-3 [Bacteroidota bacterium]